MKSQLHNRKIFRNLRLKQFQAVALGMAMASFSMFSTHLNAQGTWTKITAAAPDPNFGVMLLLSDGTVMAKSSAGSTDGYGKIWDRLTPDSHGSYVNGTWSKTSIAPMINSRLYFSSQVLQDGRVYVAGGEYGSGNSKAETYDPLTNVWTATPNPGHVFSDANSEILPDGRVLNALVEGSLRGNLIYNPATNTFINGASCLGIHNESTWVKLPDGSILMVDRQSTSSERYIPSLNTWVSDATLPVSLYDPYGLECGGGVLLPDGRAFFIGSTGATAYYTPSGTNSPGTWAAGPTIPNSLGAPDAAAAMMVNGHVLMAVSPKPTSANHFPTPTYFAEFNPLTNKYKPLTAPAGGNSVNISCYLTNMVCLPDGTILYGQQSSNSYYVYTPSGAVVSSGKPTISSIVKDGTGSSYTITGTQFNGISEGATYGDDFQMNTNYPVIRLTSGTNVYYARTFNWSSTGVKTGSLPTTAQFTLPAGLPAGTYSLVVTANGIASNAVSFTPASPAASSYIAESATSNDNTLVVVELNAYPNPAKDQTTIYFTTTHSTNVSIKVYDVNGKETKALLNATLAKGDHTLPLNTSSFSKGIYFIKMVTDSGIKNQKLIVQ